MGAKQQAYKKLADTMIKNFSQRNIEAFYCDDRNQAVSLAMEMMKDGNTVGFGGSETLNDIGILDTINIDGNGNRVACLIHGPEHVILIVGMNKVVTDVESGVARVRNIASPANAARLGTRTPCGAVGHCGNCNSPDCMCCQVVITRHSRHTGRIKVILVGEELGY